MFYYCLTCTKLAVEKLNGLKETHYCLPRPFIRMIQVNKFAVNLAKAGKGFKEIKTMVEQVYGENTIKNGLAHAHILDILKKV